MASQVGVQSGARLGIHSHLNISQGGILNEYSRDGAYRRPYRTGALLAHTDNDTERSLTGIGAWTLMKQFRVNSNRVGSFQYNWEMKNFDNVTAVQSRFYLNGALVGAIENNATNIWVNKSHDSDINLNEGDTLEIWGHDQGDTVYIRMFRIYYDWRIEYFGNGTRNVLNAPLALTDLDVLDLTVVI